MTVRVGRGGIFSLFPAMQSIVFIILPIFSRRNKTACEKMKQLVASSFGVAMATREATSVEVYGAGISKNTLYHLVAIVMRLFSLACKYVARAQKRRSSVGEVTSSYGASWLSRRESAGLREVSEAWGSFKFEGQ